MDKLTTFCENCRDYVEYSTKTLEIISPLKGEEYNYAGEQAFCNSCGNEVYVHEMMDRNLKALYDVYREKNDIIPLDKVMELPEKYDIGKRPLSLLLGWGEMTLSRYIDGDVPTKQYSDTLQKIYDEPEYYKNLLEENKGNLRSQYTYEKSLTKIKSVLAEERKTEPKMDLIVKYLLNKCEDITPLALQKALYYVQGFYYAFENEFIFGQDCEAWLHGPVYRKVYNKYSAYRFDPIRNEEKFYDSTLTTAEKAILDSVIKNLCCYSGKTLEAFTHLEEPWLKTRKSLPANANSERIIKKELIGEYFKAIKKKYNMLSPGDIESYAKERFAQIN